MVAFLPLHQHDLKRCDYAGHNNATWKVAMLQISAVPKYSDLAGATNWAKRQYWYRQQTRGKTTPPRGRRWPLCRLVRKMTPIQTAVSARISRATPPGSAEPQGIGPIHSAR